MSLCKNIVITGGNRGIGLELVKQTLTRFKPENLIVTYRNPEASKELLTLASKNNTVHPLMLDVRATGKYDELVTKVDTITKGAGVNLLINNSGVLKPGSNINDLNKDDLMYHFEINTVAPMMLSKAFLPLLEKASNQARKDGVAPGIARAVILNISSGLGSIGMTFPASLAYKTSKTALNQASKCMSVELLPKGILVVPIHPGFVKTDMGGSGADIEPKDSAAGMLNILETLDKSKTGHFLSYNGKEIPW